jgi:serine/threonine protein phosphatase PrpC
VVNSRFSHAQFEQQFQIHNSLKSLLMVEGIQQKLPKNFYDPLVENLVEEKSFTEQVKAISQALAMVNNPLVIMELKRNSIEGMKAPITAILINHDALQPKHLLSKSPHPIVTI